MIAHESNSQRYEAVLRISEAVTACREPEELAKLGLSPMNLARSCSSTTFTSLF